MGLGLLAVDVEGRIVVDALSAEGDPAVEAGAGRGVVAHMPFADIAGFVAAGVEKFGEGFEFGLMGVPAGVLPTTPWVWTGRSGGREA